MDSSATTQYSIRRYENGGFSENTDEVLKEFVLSVYFQDSILVKLICIPEHLEELVLGYLFSEGFISSAKDVGAIVFDIDRGEARVRLTTRAGLRNNSAAADMITTDSGDYVKAPHRFRKSWAGTVLKNMEWRPDVILKNANLLLEKSEIFKKTGNVHSAMICRADEVMYFSEDIGRYNALDKCVGGAIKDNADLSNSCLYTTGRIPSSVALKVIRAGIPMIVSRSAPTDSTLEIAEKYGLTVIGFARDNKFNLYKTKL